MLLWLHYDEQRALELGLGLGQWAVGNLTLLSS